MAPREAIASIEARLRDSGFKVVGRIGLLGHEALVARRSDFRWEWIATRLHSFVIVVAVSELDERLAEAVTAEAQQYAIKNKGGLPRGLQTGTATIPVFVTSESRPDLHPWFRREPKHRWAALRFPVLLELDRGAAVFFEGRAFQGMPYLEHLRQVVRTIVGSAQRAAA